VFIASWSKMNGAARRGQFVVEFRIKQLQANRKVVPYGIHGSIQYAYLADVPLRERRKKWFVIYGAFYRRNEELGRFGLANAANCAGTLGLAKDLRVFVQRGDNDGHLGSAAHDFACRFEPVTAWHNGIHHDNIGMQGAGLLDGLVTIGSLPTDLPSRFCLQEMANEISNDFVIVDHQNPKVFHRRRTLLAR